MIIDEAWAELSSATSSGRRRGKRAREERFWYRAGYCVVSCFQAKNRRRLAPRRQSGRADEEAVVTRLLAFLDIDEASCKRMCSTTIQSLVSSPLGVL